MLFPIYFRNNHEMTANARLRICSSPATAADPVSMLVVEKLNWSRRNEKSDMEIFPRHRTAGWCAFRPRNLGQAPP
jgi:hypothetical protein